MCLQVQYQHMYNQLYNTQFLISKSRKVLLKVDMNQRQNDKRTLYHSPHEQSSNHNANLLCIWDLHNHPANISQTNIIHYSNIQSQVEVHFLILSYQYNKQIFYIQLVMLQLKDNFRRMFLCLHCKSHRLYHLDILRIA